MRFFNDLPAHVFFVHLPVVLVPLTAVAAIVVSIRPAWRRRWGWVLLGGAAVALVTTVLAYESGQEFGEILEGTVDFSDHESYATTARVWVFLFFVATLAVVLVDRFGLPASEQVTRYAGATLVALMIATAALSVLWIYRTGDEGACITWAPTVGATC